MSTFSSEQRGLAWLVAVVFFSIGTTFALPYAANLIPRSTEAAVGRLIGRIPDIMICDGTRRPEARKSLDRLVQRIFPIYEADHSVPITIRVISGSTVNAFAGLGGDIYVYDGLIREAASPEELAAVLAHEIEHVRRRHILQGVVSRLITIEAFNVIFSHGNSMGAQTANTLVNMSFSRRQEQAADEGGLSRLKDARVDVSGYVAFFERQKRRASLPPIFSDHPAGVDRAAMAEKYRGGKTEPALDPAGWLELKSICR